MGGWRLTCWVENPVVDFPVFFFQAEDGIRDGTVTGVQTCALPILTARILVVEHEAQCPPGRLGEWLRAAGATVLVWRPWAGQEPPEAYDALVVLGGSASANDDSVPWIGPVLDMVREAAAAGTPTWGICLGHQLIGRALGGTVEVNPRGQQVGVLPLGWSAEAEQDPLFGPYLPDRAVQWNDDLVV